MKPVRNLRFPGNVLLIDGISGSGKTMITRLIDGYGACTSPVFNYTLEYICILHSKGIVDTPTARLLLGLNLDQRRYDDSISREVNLRVSDLSSVLKSRKRSEYLLSLMKRDTEENSSKRMGAHPYLSFVCHQLNHATQLIELSYEDSFFEILCVRHPYYLISHWETYVSMLGTKPRDFTLWNDYKGSTIPWFIEMYPDWYVKSDLINRAALCVIEILGQSLAKLTEERSNRVVIAFEKFVLDPTSTLSEIQRWPSIEEPIEARRIMRKEKLPRSHINIGRQLPIYKRYGAGLFESSTDMKVDFQKQESFAKQRLEPSVFKELESLSESYLQYFGEWYL